jgi:hypothetical protein
MATLLDKVTNIVSFTWYTKLDPYVSSILGLGESSILGGGYFRNGPALRHLPSVKINDFNLFLIALICDTQQVPARYYSFKVLKKLTQAFSKAKHICEYFAY